MAGDDVSVPSSASVSETKRAKRRFTWTDSPSMIRSAITKSFSWTKDKAGSTDCSPDKSDINSIPTSDLAELTPSAITGGSSAEYGDDPTSKADRYNFIPMNEGKYALELAAGFNETVSTYEYVVCLLGEWREKVPEISPEQLEEGFTAPKTREEGGKKGKGRKYFELMRVKGAGYSELENELKKHWWLLQLYYGKAEAHALEFKVFAWTKNWANRATPLTVTAPQRSESLVRPSGQNNMFAKRLERLAVDLQIKR
jgi:hypothetical protein